MAVARGGERAGIPRAGTIPKGGAVQIPGTVDRATRTVDLVFALLCPEAAA